ncbi:MAG: NFACT family protein [Bacteroidota bacterium]
MVGNYFTLQALTAEAAEILPGARIAEAFSQDRSEVILSFDSPLPSLVISCRPESATFYFHPTFQRAKRNSANVLKESWGRRVESLSLHPADRIVDIRLEGDRRIAALMFGPSSNVLILGKEDTILDAFQKSKGLVGTSIRIAPSEQVFDLRNLSQFHGSLAAFTVLAALRKLFPLFAQPLAEELLFRAHVESSTPAGEIDEPRLRTLSSAIQQILVELQHPRPRVYTDEETRGMVLSIINLTSLSRMGEREFATTHEAVRYVVTRRRAGKSLEQRRSIIMGHIRSSVARAKRSLEAVRNDGENAARAGEYELFGSLLMANGDAGTRGEKSAVFLHEARTIHIPLDPRLSQMQNAQKYFEKSKRAKVATEQTTGRASDLEDRIADGETLLAALEQASTPEDLKRIMTERSEALAGFGIGEKGVADPQPFRRFIVDGGFEVLAGKSSENNDDLTLHHAKPQDLWFHARGSSGSHVILKVSTGKGEPGKKAREQAAAIAAYYSKMKTAGLVPVAMTEKKYVRKPKGAKPGSVVLEREKVIFVKPALPRDSEGK